MSADWVESEAASPRVREWLHVPTGVVLFVREGTEGYGVHVRATESGSVDTVSIGDPETGRFRQFDDRDPAVEWADGWKDSEALLRALEAADPDAAAEPDAGDESDAAAEPDAGAGADGQEPSEGGEGDPN